MIAELTEREVEVLTCLGEGLPNGKIAQRLYLSEATVKSYVSRILVKLQCDNWTQAGPPGPQRGPDPALTRPVVLGPHSFVSLIAETLRA